MKIWGEMGKMRNDMRIMDWLYEYIDLVSI
jgi:hypothetical protein